MRFFRSARVFCVLLLLAALGIAVNFWWKYHQVQKLTAEVRAMGGSVDFEYAGPHWLRDWAQQNDAVPYITWLWTDLHTLMFSNGAPVDDAWLARVTPCPELLWLDLRKTKVTGAGLRHFRDCQKLGQIDLSDCPLADADLESLKGLKSLWSLRVAGTQVTDAGLETLQRIPFLEDLDLSATKVTDAALPRLAEFPRLKNVNVTGTQVTRAGIDQNGSPRLKIVGP
jgi:hypothetical protein